jgi:ubiquinone/menaquinone biosynthesis C-methylase UbiE
MSFFRYQELKYYSFALKAGLLNFVGNRFRIGVKKSIGKITQPINWYTRFPEYYFFDRAISQYLTELPRGKGAKILDIGSPKMIGLYLACKAEVEITLTDISALNLDEYRVIWERLALKATGRALFQLQDARLLQIPDAQFDVVYSMSVIEHIEGADGDSQALREMIRVLKPGGLLVVSVPFGPKYVEQKIIGVSGAVLQTEDRKSYFFQRIYDEAAFKTRILAAAGLQKVTFATVWRRHPSMHRSFARLHENIRGALGVFHPLLSAIANQSCDGINTGFTGNYGTMHSLRDIYGDLVMIGVKSLAPK